MMTESEANEVAVKAVKEWLDEIESYSTRAERMLGGIQDDPVLWLNAAAEVGANAVREKLK